MTRLILGILFVAMFTVLDAAIADAQAIIRPGVISIEERSVSNDLNGRVIIPALNENQGIVRITVARNNYFSVHDVARWLRNGDMTFDRVEMGTSNVSVRTDDDSIQMNFTQGFIGSAETVERRLQIRHPEGYFENYFDFIRLYKQKVVTFHIGVERTPQFAEAFVPRGNLIIESDEPEVDVVIFNDQGEPINSRLLILPSSEPGIFSTEFTNMPVGNYIVRLSKDGLPSPPLSNIQVITGEPVTERIMFNVAEDPISIASTINPIGTSDRANIPNNEVDILDDNSQNPAPNTPNNNREAETDTDTRDGSDWLDRMASAVLPKGSFNGDFVYEAETIANSPQGEMTIKIKQSANFDTEFILMEMETAVGVVEMKIEDGQGTMKVGDNEMAMPAESRDQLLAEYFRSYIYLATNKDQFNVEYLGMQVMDGKEYAQIRIVDDIVTNLYINPDTNLPEITTHSVIDSESGERITFKTVAEDWRVSDGVMMPYRSTTYSGDDVEAITTISKHFVESSATNEEIYTITDVSAAPVGGMAAFSNYVRNNLEYPTMARAAGIQGRVIVRAIVNTDGSVSDISVIRPVGGGLDEEAIRMVREYSGWTPAKQNGRDVRSYINIPINFSLN